MKQKGRYRKAVFIVTYRKEKDKVLYLLLKRKLHWKGYEFPKGGVEYGEELSKTVKREIKEETGKTAEDIKRYKISEKYEYPKAYQGRRGVIGQTYELFSAEVKGEKVNIDRMEHSSYIWLEFKKAVKLLRWPNQKKCLTHINERLKQQK